MSRIAAVQCEQGAATPAALHGARLAVAALALAPGCALAIHQLHPHAEESIAFAAGYTGEAWRVSEGGIETGSRYIDKFELAIEVNGEKALNIPGLRLFANLMQAGGDGPSADLAGDAQGVSGNEAEDAPRVRELWLEQHFGASNRHGTLLGLYDASSEFDVTPSAQLFTGAAQGTGTDLAQSGENDPSVFPASGLALRYSWQLGNAWLLQAAAIDGVPGDPEHPDRLSVDLSSDDGVLWLVELAHASTRLHKLALGYWEYSASFERLGALDASGQPRSGDGNRGAYALADIALIDHAGRYGEHSEPRLSAYVRAGVAEEQFNRFEHYVGAGLVWRGLLPQGDDEIGIALAHARNGDDWRREAAAQGVPTGRDETSIELTWRVPVGEYLALQPVLQYIVDPDTNPLLDDAVVFGLRFELSFEAQR